MRPIRQTLLLKALFGGLLIMKAAGRRPAGLASFFESAALAGLTDESLHSLTVAIYNREGSYFKGDSLFDWERAWFAADLPAPPARLLIGGAGSGREAAPLSAAGYEILAFDPAPSFVRHARSDLGPLESVAFIEADYDDLVSGEGPRAAGLLAAIERIGTFDAVILGWGSIMHITRAATRGQLLERLRRLCPSGPVLMSFWERDDSDSFRRRGRGGRLGAALGRVIGAAAGNRRSVVRGDTVASHVGFCHVFSREEIAELAARDGYEVRAPSQAGPETQYGHLTLVPKTPQPQA